MSPGQPDRALTQDERELLLQAVARQAGTQICAEARAAEKLFPLVEPALRALDAHYYQHASPRNRVLRAIMHGALHVGRSPAGWTVAEWSEVRSLFGGIEKLALTVVAVRGYGVVLTQGNHLFYRTCRSLPLARRLFGRSVVDGECARVLGALTRIGYRVREGVGLVPLCVAELLLWIGSPSLDAVSDENFGAFAADPPSGGSRIALCMVSSGLTELGIVTHRFQYRTPPQNVTRPQRLGVSEEWLGWCERWRDTSSTSPSTREGRFSELLTAGRWLTRYHPTIISPADWTMDLALDYIRYVDQKRVGEDLPSPQQTPRTGQPLSASGKSELLAAARAFFRDLHEWGWIARRFNPYRGFAVPKLIRRALGPNPRPIDDGHWLKLRAASLALRHEDLPSSEKGRAYLHPSELIQAVAVAWTFTGCRADEIQRLELGCTYVEHVPEQIDSATGEVVPAFDQPMLRIPANKTRGEFVKPIEEPMIRALAAWECVRPPQPKLLDRITGRPTAYLFCHRGRRINKGYLNRVIIPILLRKAGLPPEDTRGAITSHRARATLATKLYNPSSGLTAIEVMRWLGHTNLASGQHYVELTPVRLMTAFHKSAKLTENLRCISVLVDSRPEPGQPIFRYDLGHGWCANAAYAMCAHRMACARCTFYEPAETFADALVRQSDRYLRMLQELKLTDDERAATSGDVEAIDGLLTRLAGEPIPDRGSSRMNAAGSLVATPSENK